ncbi:MAG: hypothetical protein BJ554DRAFT_8241, partial [Olpidium bornovanus]
MAGATRNKARLPREAGSLHEPIEKIRNAAEKTVSDNKRTSRQRRADADTLDPNALDVLERLERVGIQGCYDKKPIVTSTSDPPASKSTIPGQDGGSSEKDYTRFGHLQQTAGSASASEYPSRSKAKLQSEQTGKRQKGKEVTGDANPPGSVSSDRDTESEPILERRRQRKDDNAVIRCRLSPSDHLYPDQHGDTEGAEQDTHQDNDHHHRCRHHQQRRAHTSRRYPPSNSNHSDETDSKEDSRRHCRRCRDQRRRRSPSSSSNSSSSADTRYHDRHHQCDCHGGNDAVSNNKTLWKKLLDTVPQYDGTGGTTKLN